MRAPKLPDKVKVGWRDYAIIEMSSAVSYQERRYGDTRHVLTEIRVQTEGCNSRQTAHTLLHEILHCIVYMFGVLAKVPPEDQEEHVVAQMADGLTNVLRDNPEVAAYIHHHLVHGG